MFARPHEVGVVVAPAGVSVADTGDDQFVYGNIGGRGDQRAEEIGRLRYSADFFRRAVRHGRVEAGRARRNAGAKTSFPRVAGIDR